MAQALASFSGAHMPWGEREAWVGVKTPWFFTEPCASCFMTRKILTRIGCLTLPLLMAVGCAHQARETSADFSPLETSTLTPTSDRSQARVYADTPAGVGQYPPPSGVSPDDWRLAEQLRQMLTTDRDLHAPAVAAVVNHGVVTLKGHVRTKRDRDQVQQAVTGVPGVQQVVNQIEIKNWPGSYKTGESQNY